MTIKQHKVVVALPIPLEPDSIYYVRNSGGFDIHVTNNSGVVVGYELNASLGKVDKVVGKGLSDTNFTQVEKDKLSGVAVEATKNRADSENADKLHTHTVEQVSGLDTTLTGKANKTTQVVAGTGLTGGGDLSDNRTLTVNYGTAAGTATQGNDSRLSDSREWTAVTITQAEAEAGIETTRRAWTAQRVRQANVAWWNGATSAWGRGFVNSADASAGRTALELGNVDDTRDVDKRVGSFAIHDTRDVVSVPNNVPHQTGLFEFKLLASVGSPPKPSSEGYAHVLTTNGWQADGTGGWPTQISLGDALSLRKGTGVTTWGPWYELISTDTTIGATGQSSLYPMTQKATTDAIANIPSVPKSAAYTATTADKGASIDTSAGVTIPASVFTVGDVIVVTNTSASSISITPDSGVTIRLAGSASTGLRTLTGYGVATFRMVSSNVWFATGVGLS